MRKQKKLYYRIRSFQPGDIDEVSLVTFDAKMDDFDKVAEEFVLSVEDMCHDHADALGERVAQWENLVKNAENDVRVYKQRMKIKVAELRNLDGNQDGSNHQLFLKPVMEEYQL